MIRDLSRETKNIPLKKYIQLLIINIKDKLGIYGSISLAVFLFILFFQPFPNEFPDVENALIFTAGFGVIVLLLLYFSNLVFSGLLHRQKSEAMSYFHGIALLILCSVAFAFYLRYVGQVKPTFPIILKIFLICLAAPVSLRIIDQRNDFRQKNIGLTEENTTLKRKIALFEEGDRNKTIEFSSGSLSENIKLLLTDIILVKSADNYIELFYRDGDITRRKLVRNTLNNIEQQLKPHPLFLRCHRTFIVNVDYIEKINRKISSYWLVIRNIEEPVPVSRQYLLRLKEALGAKQG